MALTTEGDVEDDRRGCKAAAFRIVADLTTEA
jgi:hypothetical protein